MGGMPTGTDSWPDRLAALADFLTEYGRAPRQRDRYRDFAIGKWLIRVQVPGALDEVRAAQLAELLATVKPLGREEVWVWMRNLVADYMRIEGEPPFKNLVWRGEPIGQWTRDQRKAYGKGTLRADRIVSLEAIDGWVWNAEELDFRMGLAHFIDYRARHGQGWVPVAYVSPDGYPLGSWSRDRRRFRSRMTEEQRNQLTEAGFLWEPPDDLVRPAPEAEAQPATRRARSVAAARARTEHAATAEAPVSRRRRERDR